MNIPARLHQLVAGGFMLLATLTTSEVNALCGIIAALIAISAQIGGKKEKPE